MGYFLAIAFFGVAGVSAYVGFRKGATYKTKYDALKAEIEAAANHYSIEVRGFVGRLKTFL